ncbi:spondin domain-containing protein [Photobacterium iliopiscarium]|uniref:Spondin domain-containing protein n=1 Tax=Photobacterium iliopiscarium TaxID=56192 RepID=A0A2T3M8F6_9GAMM|nr:spondin domain-containing protein [Photobacterium iliopiscarium]PSV88682.1 hypothetical protein C9I88_19565 [Photobacterium iliopiscarium]
MNLKLLVIISSLFIFLGCSDTDNTKAFKVTVKNNTNSQPLSPFVVLSHNEDYHLFKIGMPASIELEHLAEGGNHLPLAVSKTSNNNIYNTFFKSEEIPPGGTESIILSSINHKHKYLSIASMLVNTNDAFIGETGLNISSLNVGEVIKINAPVWDAGTEANSELAATIPGPVSSGEGFNPIRNDKNQVVIHPGVISNDDGLTYSALDTNLRFLNPGAVIFITRIK